MNREINLFSPLISIITVVYNAKDDLEKTISSIKKQTYPNLEFIVIDGNSSDGTQFILTKEKDFIDVAISEPDDGLYYAMNKGNKLASGDFALFMNAGDIFVSENSISKVVSSMTSPEHLYYANTIVYFGNLYKQAPKLHHQSVFFPKSYYKKNDYKSEIFKITAEGDYISKAASDLEAKNINVNLIYSKVEGVRIQSYSTLRGMRLMYNEITSANRHNRETSSIIFKSKYIFKSLIKYFAFKLGGLKLVTRVVLNSYPDLNKSNELKFTSKQ